MSRKRKSKHGSTRYGYDKHHLLFYRSEWNKGCRMLLRRAFVYEIPVVVHRELHRVVKPVPPLMEWEARKLWHDLKDFGYEMNIFEAYRWLIEFSPNDEFRNAITEQFEFIKEHLPAN